MRKNSKRALYESIMNNVSKQVKKTLNESNMSYCRFENTLGDFEDCLETLVDAVENEKLLDLNEYEKRAFDLLYVAAQEFVEQYEQYINIRIDNEDYEDDDFEDETF